VIRSKTKPVLWTVIPASNGVCFVQRKSVRFAFMFDDSEAKELCKLLNTRERQIARLKDKIHYIQQRS
jgi:hypothetical protein